MRATGKAPWLTRASATHRRFVLFAWAAILGAPALVVGEPMTAAPMTVRGSQVYVFRNEEGQAMAVTPLQAHGVRIGKRCETPQCPGDVSDCQIEIGHADAFGDTIEILDAWDMVDPAGDAVRVPDVGNLPIVMVAGNTNCTIGGALPCLICEAGSTACGVEVPDAGVPGVVTFLQNEYVIQPDDPTPLNNQANIRVRDLCDVAPDNCSTLANLVQFTASTDISQCDDGNPCTTDTCEEGVCTNAPDCTDDENCPDDGNVCTTESCELATGCCLSTPECTDAADCPDDGNACTDEICTDPGCCESVPQCTLDADCDDMNACTADACDADGCCVFTPECTLDTDCDDMNVCTADTCDADGCCVFTPECTLDTDCDDMNACTADTCDVNGCCTFTPECTDPADCDDGDPCTSEVCTAEGCCENPPLCVIDDDCSDDGNACTTETCGPDGCCVSTPDCVMDADCPDDGNPCTTESCSPEGCCTATPDCVSKQDCPDDGNACTAEVCTQDGCCDVIADCAIDADCDDMNECTTDACTVDGCCENIPLCETAADCDDMNVCTTDVCEAAGCCSNTPECTDPGDCDDQDECTADSCTVDGCCENIPLCETAVDCDDMNVCTTDVCEATGCCSNTPECTDPADCDDQDACTADSCTVDGCCENVPECVTNQDCDDQMACTVDTCVEGCCEHVCQTPGITCPDDQVFECDAVGDFGDPVVDDACSVMPLIECTEESVPGDLPQEETITRTCTVTNDCGNAAECMHTIDVVDTTPPEVTCPPHLEFDCDAIGDFGEPEVTDNCDPDPDITVEVEEVINDCRPGVTAGISPPPKLTITRTVSASDGSLQARGEGGNVVTCVQQIDIFDREPPVILSCPEDMVRCPGDDLNFEPPSCEDNCGPCRVTCSRSDGLELTDPMSDESITITCVALDECDSASAACEVAVTGGPECVEIIPTMSEWGMVILTLLLLIGGKVYFGQREETAWA